MHSEEHLKGELQHHEQLAEQQVRTSHHAAAADHAQLKELAPRE
jgi:hypothetical protein